MSALPKQPLYKSIIRDDFNYRWLGFRSPIETVSTVKISEVINHLEYIEKAAWRENRYAVGYVAYEAASAFDSSLAVRDGGDSPLLHFDIYNSYDVIEDPESGWEGIICCECDCRWGAEISQIEYDQAICNIKDCIARGETYQVNFTYRLRGEYAFEPYRAFINMVGAQECAYGAYLDCGSRVICSASPELFFTLVGDQIVSKPMKGTASRGLWYEDDMSNAEWLRYSGKNRAENAMIVDMIRNDIGRIARTGSVRVNSCFEVERYPTVWQMTSTVEGQTDSGLVDIFGALFPCASITGAPKVKTMEIIAGLEKSPRGVYTGCVGFVGPQRSAQFNVAIRTAVFDRESVQAEYGVGGGVVWDSTAGEEYDESLLKARILSYRSIDFSLLETILFESISGFYLLDLHMDRLRKSAEYFGISLDCGTVKMLLDDFAEMHMGECLRVRLLLSRDGEMSLEHYPFASQAGDELPLRLAFADGPIDSSDPFLYHKTTNRIVYERARKMKPDVDDVILFNERGEITECTIYNLVVKIYGALYTPPLGCGLLGGIYRRYLLDSGEVAERAISVEELKDAENVFCINSVRRWREAVIV